MRVAVCFQLKKSKSRLGGKCPLYLRCTLNGQRFETSTGFFLDPETWNESTQMVKGRTEEANVKSIEAKLSQDYSFGTLMQYKTTRKRLGEFLKIREGRKDIPISK